MGEKPFTSILGIWLSGLVFAVLHSGLATFRAKAWFCTRGIAPQRYRLYYSLVSLLLTLLWLLYVHSQPDQLLYRINGPWRWLLHALQLFGLYLFWLSLKPIDVAAFLGLRPFANGTEPFIEQGVYRYVRHPMYAAIILMLLAHPDQTVNSLALSAFVTAYFAVGSRFEERRMLTMHPEYAAYRERVPAFIPRLRRR